MQISLTLFFLFGSAIFAYVTVGGCSAPNSSPSSITTGAIRPAIVSAPENQIPDTVVVARGDTLSSIALRYHVSVAAVMYVNDLKGTTIKTGQELHIPGTYVQ